MPTFAKDLQQTSETKMRKKRFSYIMAMVLCLLLSVACKDNRQQQAEQLLLQAGELFEAGQYQEALSTIDSLRKVYPNAIDTRKAALKLYQEGVDPLAKIASTEDRKYDLVNGIYLGAMCLEDGNKQANLKVADETCEMFMKDCQNRVRFMKLQKAIRKEL